MLYRWAMPRFVILTHDHPSLHWDFMLERGSALQTWRLLAEPVSAPVIAAEALRDHRLAYLDYEGPVSGSRGIVERWDSGTFDVMEESASRLILKLHGEKLRGTALLEETDQSEWSFQFTID